MLQNVPTLANNWCMMVSLHFDLLFTAPFEPEINIDLSLNESKNLRKCQSEPNFYDYPLTKSYAKY